MNEGQTESDCLENESERRLRDSVFELWKMYNQPSPVVSNQTKQDVGSQTTRLEIGQESVHQKPLGQLHLDMLAPKLFTGKEDYYVFINSFDDFVTFKGLNEQQTVNLLPFCLSGTAKS